VLHEHFRDLSLAHTQEAFMSIGNDDTGEAVVAFASGVLIGVAATLLFVKIHNNRSIGSKKNYEDYQYDGGDLFI